MIPPFLKRGDKVGVISPAGRVSKAGIEKGIDIFKSWGLDIVIGSHVFDEYSYLSSSDDNRFSDLQNMIDDNSIQAIIASRGGYGCVRLLDRLNIENLKIHPKWIVGFSDITVLHSFLNSHNIPSIHGMMLNSPDQKRKPSDKDVLTMYDALFGILSTYSFPTDINNRNGIAEGKLFGGNLSVLCSMLNSPYSVNAEGKILVIEDIDEYYYQIDRMLQQLKYSGVLSKIKGLIIGGMTNIKDTTISFNKTIYEMVYDAVGNHNYPICFNAPIGHIEQDNHALYFGIDAKLEISNKHVSLRY